MMELHDEVAFRGRLEELGPEEVRATLARGVWNRNKVASAEAWLKIQDDHRASEAHAEAMKINRSARNAAWVAAIAAALSLPIAVVALVLTALKP